jgi:DNA polymerase III sliding clamp (beta) subunit (PCNA family)
MKTTLEVREVKEFLDVCKALGIGKAKLPVLNCILVECSEHETVLSYTNLEQYVRYAKKSYNDAGTILVPFDLLKTLKGQEVTLSGNADVISVNHIRCTNVINPEEYPQVFTNFPAFKTIAEGVMFPLFKSLLSKTLPAVSKDLSRPQLCGINLELEDETLIIAATNTHMLLKNELSVINRSQDKFSLIMPVDKTTNMAKAILAMQGNLVAIHVATCPELSGTYLVFITGGKTLVTRCVDGIFPNFRRVLHEYEGETLRLRKQDLLSTIEEFKPILEENGRRFLFLKGDFGFKLSARSEKVSSEVFPVQFKGEVPRSHCFDYKLLKDCLSVIDTEWVEFSTNPESNQRPVNIQSFPNEQGFNCVLMPMRFD